MKKVFFRSLFFIVMLLLLACTQKKNEAHTDDLQNLTVRQHIAAAFDTLSPKEDRIAFAERAIHTAKQSHSDSLIGMAFYTKASILENLDDKYACLSTYKKYAQTQNDTLNLAGSNGMLGDYFKGIGKSDSAFYYYNQSRIYYELRKDSLQVVYKLVQIADIYRQFNDYVGLESASTEALKFLNDRNNTNYNPTIYTNLGIAFKHLSEYADAIRYYKLAGQIATDSLTIANTQNNIAVVYKLQGRFAEAEKILRQLLQSNAVNSNSATKGRILANLGSTLYKAGKADGIALLLESEKERQKARDSIGLISSYIHLADAYRGTKPLEAIKYAQLAYRTASFQNSTDDRLDALKLLIANSNPNAVKQYTLAYLRINDSIMKVRQSATNRFAKIRYDATVAMDENLQLKADNALNALQIQESVYEKRLLILGILLIIALGSIGYMLIKKRHRRDKERQVYITETRLSKKVHDEFANDIYSTIAYTESEDLSVVSKKEKLLDHLANIYTRSRNIARENSPIVTDERFPEQLRQMLSEFNSANCTIILNGIESVQWLQDSDENKVAIYRVLHELMVNMKKHSSATLVGIRFEYHGGNLSILYSDNGVGLPENELINKNGLQNVENRIHGIGGTITFESGPENGLKVLIRYKAKK